MVFFKYRYAHSTNASQDKAVIENYESILIPPLVPVVPDLVGWHEEKHWSVEAPADIFLSHPLLHKPHFLPVKSSIIFSYSFYLNLKTCNVVYFFFCEIPCCRKADDQQLEEEGKPNEDGPGRDNDSLYGATVFSFSDIKHMYLYFPLTDFAQNKTCAILLVLIMWNCVAAEKLMLKAPTLPEGPPSGVSRLPPSI